MERNSLHCHLIRFCQKFNICLVVSVVFLQSSCEIRNIIVYMCLVGGGRERESMSSISKKKEYDMIHRVRLDTMFSSYSMLRIESSLQRLTS